MWSAIGLVCLAALSSASAQAPLPCLSPAMWEAHFSRFDPSEGHQFAVDGFYHYDKIGQRKAFFERDRSDINSTYRFQEIIHLYNLKKSYHIDVQTRACTVGELTHPFHAHDVPTFARFRGLFYLGSSAVPNDVLEMAKWDYQDNERNYFWEGSFTSEGCIPYHSNEYNHTTFGMRFESFWDVTPGIANPDVFLPPPECFPN